MVLIASNSNDHATVLPVVNILQDSGKDVLFYKADLVASGKIHASFVIDKNGEIFFSYGDVTFGPDDIHAAWYRRPNTFAPDEELKTLDKIYLERQRKACQDSFWFAVPREKWINPPQVTESAFDDKLLQLRLARKHGFVIPRTVISNSWEEAYHSFGAKEVIVKLPNGKMFVNDKARYVATTIIDDRRVGELSNSLPFPGIWQEFLAKKREWRITVVGEKVFPVAIYTSSSARDDWREHQFDTTKVQFKVEHLPGRIGKQCVGMLQEMGTRYGAFDFIETNNGEFIFLEVNLNGQFQWLVKELHLPISEAIAEELSAFDH